MVKQTGDGILATFDGATRAVRSAAALLEAANLQGITLRAGLHTGEIELGPRDVVGIAVHIAKSHLGSSRRKRESSFLAPSSNSPAGHGLQFEPRGERQLKGVPGNWPIFAALPPT